MTANATTAASAATEAARRADFTHVRYAQCWEDADVLLQGLNIQPGDVCLSIASAGDNALSMLTRNPSKVIAIDLNPAQLACVQLRKAAYLSLDHDGLLKLVGSRACDDRKSLYQACRANLIESAGLFWDARPDFIAAGIGSAGKFEAYFALFRRWVLPCIHGRRCVTALLTDKSKQERQQFYARTWNNRRWRLLFRLFFSRAVMGKFGRDPAFFQYVQGSVSQPIFQRAEHALVELSPADNPYLQWILTGRHQTALPHALRPENFDLIRANLNRLEIRQCSIEDYLSQNPGERIDRFNLSDIFEYMSPDNFHSLLALLVDAAHPGARLAYWNMLVPRSRPEFMAHRLVPLEPLSTQLHKRDKAFFYSRFIVEEVT